MSEPPYFSICIPCFNHSKFVGRTIQSVLDQDFTDFEIVVADNASTDDSRDIVRSFGDPRIRLVENRYNIGFAPNLQQVTRHARGRYINLLSSDDLMNPGALRTYAGLIESHPDDRQRLVLMSQAWNVDENDTPFQYRATVSGNLSPARFRSPALNDIEAQPLYTVHRGWDVFAFAMKRLETIGMFCSVVYSRELWEAVEGYNSTQLINPDNHFITKVMRQNPTVLYVNRPLYSYREHSMGQTRQRMKERVLKLQVDRYNLLMQYNEDWLEGTGVTREQQRAIFVNRDCADYAIVELANGNWLFASRLAAFAWAAYAATAIRQAEFLGLCALLLMGPVGVLLARILMSVYRSRRKELSSLSDAVRAAASTSASPTAKVPGETEAMRIVDAERASGRLSE